MLPRIVTVDHGKRSYVRTSKPEKGIRVAGMALNSDTADAFGAKVETPGDQEGLYLVVAEAGDLPRLLAEVRGRPVVILGDRRVLALMTMAASSTLSRHPLVGLCGPVSVDPQRFNVFVETIGLTRPP